jgi:hypothetical protein
MREMYKTVEYRVKDSLEWWELISEKRCVSYSHSQEYDYNEDINAFLTSRKSKTLTPEDEKPTILWTSFWVVWCINFLGE